MLSRSTTTIKKNINEQVFNNDDIQSVNPEDLEKHKSLVQKKLESSDSSESENDIILDSEQQEALIEKLETKKHRLKVEYRTEADKSRKVQLKEQYEEVTRLLASVKECDAWDKVYKNKQRNDALMTEFKARYKRLPKTDFNKIIDLTAPKGERKPDISTDIWNKSKTVVFKGKTYREAPLEKKKKFQHKMQLRPMPKEFRDDLQKRQEKNCQAYHIRNADPNALKSKKYDPFNYQGLSSW